LIILIGLPGSGKSSVGRLLARRLQLPFIDSDQVLEQRLGCTIREFFEREGEERFRDWEQAVLDELTQGAPCVLSTGGGAVLRPANREHLRQRGRVFYLCTRAAELYRRVRHDHGRPLLQVADPLQKLQQLYAERDPLCRATAHHVVETGRSPVARLVNGIVAQIKQAASAQGRPAPDRHAAP